MRLTTVEFPGDAMMLRLQDGSVTVAIAIRIQRYSGRRQVVVPQGVSASLPGQRTPTALQVALARGHRWLRQIKGGQARNLADIADREKIDRSYVSRMANLATLASDIQAAILEKWCCLTWPSTRHCVGRRSVGVLTMWLPRYVRTKHCPLRRLDGILSLAVLAVCASTGSRERERKTGAETPKPGISAGGQVRKPK